MRDSTCPALDTLFGQHDCGSDLILSTLLDGYDDRKILPYQFASECLKVDDGKHNKNSDNTLPLHGVITKSTERSSA